MIWLMDAFVPEIQAVRLTCKYGTGIMLTAVSPQD